MNGVDSSTNCLECEIIACVDPVHIIASSPIHKVIVSQTAVASEHVITRTPGHYVSVEGRSSNKQIVSIFAMKRIGVFTASKDVIAGSASKIVYPLISIEYVCTLLTKNGVGARLSIHDIVAAPSDKEIVSCIPIERIHQVVANAV